MATLLLAHAMRVAEPFWGAVIGMAASAVDQALFGPKTHQTAPRMDSMSLQDSAYGGMIPIPFGMVRTTGNIIFATSFVSHSHTQKVGKGGGSSSTSYTYTISLAIALCKGPIAKIRRIWADGTQYILSGISGNTYTFRKESDTSVTFSCRLYLGTDDQLPDSYMESKNGGVGTTPAYRGLAYVVFQDLDLTNFGSRIPQMQFEVVSNNMATAANYSGQTVDGKTFTNVDLSFSFWSNATVKNCTFNNCRLDNSTWSKATVNNCYFNVNNTVLRNSDWSEATITDTHYEGTDCRGSNYIGAKITDSYFDGTDLRGASFDTGS